MPAIHLTFNNASVRTPRQRNTGSGAPLCPAPQASGLQTVPQSGQFRGRRRSHHCSLSIGRNASSLCAHVAIARTFFSRLIGLLAHRELSPNHGLWLKPSSGIHTMFMRFPIDIVALDRDNNILKTAHNVPPWRIIGVPRRTRSVLELPAGHLRLHPVAVGDRAWLTYV